LVVSLVIGVLLSVGLLLARVAVHVHGLLLDVGRVDRAADQPERRIALLLSFCLGSLLAPSTLETIPWLGITRRCTCRVESRVASSGTKVPPDRHAGRDRVEQAVGQWRTSPVAPRPAGGDGSASHYNEPTQRRTEDRWTR
jgi:hypothetical protein